MFRRYKMDCPDCRIPMKKTGENDNIITYSCTNCGKEETENKREKSMFKVKKRQQTKAYLALFL